MTFGFSALTRSWYRSGWLPLKNSRPTVFSVAVGKTEGFTDLRIADLLSPELAFRGRELKLSFTVKAYGLTGKTVPIGSGTRVEYAVVGDAVNLPSRMESLTKESWRSWLFLA